eukprot:COSAG01_NODE_40129_length_467_cov_1.394022_2_plen_50_part_01
MCACALQNISLYFLDYENAYIRRGVKLMSGNLKYQTVAPMAFVEDFANGK